MQPITVKVTARTNEKGERAQVPIKATEMSAGYDLSAFIDRDILLRPGDRVKVPTGLCIELPENSVGCIYGRSGLGANFGITLPNCVGVIDSDYRGEISVALTNHSKEDYTIKPGDRIAQMVIMPIINTRLEVANTLSDTERGSGGFGSSGK